MKFKRAKKQQEYNCSWGRTTCGTTTNNTHTYSSMYWEIMCKYQTLCWSTNKSWTCVCECVRASFTKKFDFRRIFFKTRDILRKKTEKMIPIFTSIVILIKILISIHFIPFLEIRFILNVMAFVFSLFRYPQSSALRTSCFLCVCVFLVCVYASIIQCVFF